MPLPRGGGISPLPSMVWIKPRHTNVERSQAYPSEQLLICLPFADTVCILRPSYSSFSFSPSDRGLNHLRLPAVLCRCRPPRPLSSSVPRPPFSSPTPTIASSCGPRRARSLALTWQVPGLRTTASNNTFPTWGTKRRRWVSVPCLCSLQCKVLFFFLPELFQNVINAYLTSQPQTSVCFIGFYV